MSPADHSEGLGLSLASFAPTRFGVTRSLAIYSAAITESHEPHLRTSARLCLDHGVEPAQLYEATLQSYLFLGFPRMLTAAEALAENMPTGVLPLRSTEATGYDMRTWLERGEKLCRLVYDSKYEALKTRVTGLAPEIFLWMELEGYGKVLSRPGLDIVDREMAIVACLMMENRMSQLRSHLRGALNVGAELQLVRDVLSDLASAAPAGHTTSLEILEHLETA